MGGGGLCGRTVEGTVWEDCLGGGLCERRRNFGAGRCWGDFLEQDEEEKFWNY